MLADIKHQLLELLVSIDFVPVNLNQKRRAGEDNVFVVTGREVSFFRVRVLVTSIFFCNSSIKMAITGVCFPRFYAPLCIQMWQK